MHQHCTTLRNVPSASDSTAQAAAFPVNPALYALMIHESPSTVTKPLSDIGWTLAYIQSFGRFVSSKVLFGRS